MLIAIIDDGIDKSKLLYHNLKYNLFVDDNNEIKERDSKEYIFTPHGTTCARIIETYAKNAEFVSISVFQNIELKTSCERLFAALNWCLEKRIQLVHMSVGTEQLNDSFMIRPVIARMLMQGQIIVAAGNNKGSYTIPACLGGVIGVAVDKNLKGFAFHNCYSEKGILLLASASHRLIDASGYMSETDISNSYAAPTVTAAIHNILADREPYSVSVPSLYRELTGDRLNHLNRPDFIEDADVLNLSGETLLNHRFFFLCRQEFATVESFLHGITYGKSLVFLPSVDKKENEKVFHFIKEFKKHFKGVLLGGEIENKLLEELEHILIWNENNGGILKENYLKESSAMKECPIIFIIDNEGNGIDLACSLKGLFQEEGYECICASNQKYSYLYGLEYIPPKIEINQAIPYLCDTYEPDLIIFSSIRNSINKDIMNDMGNYIIEFSTEENKNVKQINRKFLLSPYNKIDVKGLYQHIKEYFS